MTEVGNKQGYTRVEHKKERSMEEGDDANKEEKEMEGGDDIFKGVKQIDLHALMVSSEGVVFIGKCRRK